MRSLRIVLAFAAAAATLPVLLLVILLVLPFWAVSVLTRLGARLCERNHLTVEQLIEYDPVLGWRSRANLDTYHLNVDVFQITTGEDGWRGRSSLEESDVVALGDSFAAGYGVDDRDFFAHRLQVPRIKAVGIGGYCQVQQLLWLREVRDALRGKLVVWFVYYGNDLYDNIVPDMQGYRKPFVRETGEQGGWELVSSHVSPEPWSMGSPGRERGTYYYPRLAELCSATFLSQRAYGACEFLLREGRELCAEAAAELVVLGVPDRYQLSEAGHRYLRSLGGDADTFDPAYPDLQLKAICKRLGIEFVAGQDFLTPDDYFSRDCHWNPAGNLRVAKALRDLYLSHRSRGAPGAGDGPSGRSLQKSA